MVKTKKGEYFHGPCPTSVPYARNNRTLNNEPDVGQTADESPRGPIRELIHSQR